MRKKNIDLLKKCIGIKFKEFKEDCLENLKSRLKWMKIKITDDKFPMLSTLNVNGNRCVYIFTFTSGINERLTTENIFVYNLDKKFLMMTKEGDQIEIITEISSEEDLKTIKTFIK